MHPIIVDRLSANGGVASTAELVKLGLSRHAVDRAVGVDLVRLRRGTLVDARVWKNAEPWRRHEIRARAAMRSLQNQPVALSHHSALAVQGISTYGGDERVHVIRTDGRAGRSAGGWSWHPVVPRPFLARHSDVCVVTGPMACLQVADVFGVAAGLVSADAALRGGADRQDFAEALALGRFGRGVAAARIVADRADGRIESAGESRSRWVFAVVGLPEAEPQVWIRDEGFVARVDFLFREQRTIVEFDGLLKYASPADVRAEKAREDRLRELGYEVVRLTWQDLADPVGVHAKVRAAFARAAARTR